MRKLSEFTRVTLHQRSTSTGGKEVEQLILEGVQTIEQGECRRETGGAAHRHGPHRRKGVGDFKQPTENEVGGTGPIANEWVGRWFD
jgi:hypothetical protein